MNEGVVEKIRAAGGEVYAVTSEPQRLADDAMSNWKLNFESLGDPHHEISGVCRDRGWLDIIVNTKTELVAPDETSNFSHPKGYYQPGVLALDRNGRVLYRWRGVPTRKNMGGATERPTATYVLGKLEEALKSQGEADTVDAALDEKPELDMRGVPWPIFVSILTANGWFIRPQVFAHKPGGPPIQARFLRAILRIPMFIGLWVLAFLYLPPLWVALALAAWVAWITPGVRYISEQFQNVKPP